MALATAVALGGCNKSERGTSQTTTTTSSERATTTSVTASSKAGTITSTDGSFIVSLPKGWRSEPPESGLLIKLIAKDASNVNVTVNPTADRGRTIQESAEISAKLVTDQLKAEIDPGGIEATTLDGEPARRYTYTMPPGPQIPHKVRGRQLLVDHRDVEYVVTFTGSPDAFNNDVADYEAIMNSWKWSD
jgi:hypothetical protein